MESLTKKLGSASSLSLKPLQAETRLVWYSFTRPICIMVASMCIKMQDHRRDVWAHPMRKKGARIEFSSCR